MNKTTIYIIRHAQSAANTGQKSAGHDSHLTELGIEQAKERAEDLKDIDFAAYYSSAMNRTIETAEIIKGDKNFQIQTDSNTKERSVYFYAENMNTEVAEIEEIIANELKNLSEDEKMDYKHSPGMESAKEGALRLLDQVKKVSKLHPGKNILITSHGNLMRSLLTYLGFAKYDELPVGTIENTAYFILETTDGENFNVLDTFKIHKQKGTTRVW